MEKYLSMDVQILIWLSKLGSISYAYAKKKTSSTNVEMEQKKKHREEIYPRLSNQRMWHVLWYRQLHPSQRPYVDEILSLRYNFTIYNDDISLSHKGIEIPPTFSGLKPLSDTSNDIFHRCCTFLKWIRFVVLTLLSSKYILCYSVQLKGERKTTNSHYRVYVRFIA